MCREENDNYKHTCQARNTFWLAAVKLGSAMIIYLSNRLYYSHDLKIQKLPVVQIKTKKFKVTSF